MHKRVVIETLLQTTHVPRPRPLPLPLSSPSPVPSPSPSAGQRFLVIDIFIRKAAASLSPLSLPARGLVGGCCPTGRVSDCMCVRSLVRSARSSAFLSLCLLRSLSLRSRLHVCVCVSCSRMHALVCVRVWCKFNLILFNSFPSFVLLYFRTFVSLPLSYVRSFVLLNCAQRFIYFCQFLFARDFVFFFSFYFFCVIANYNNNACIGNALPAFFEALLYAPMHSLSLSA